MQNPNTPANKTSFFSPTVIIAILAAAAAAFATYYYYIHGYVIAYGDAESHLNIAKRVISSPTPGFAQLGGVWLPLPHLLLIPFVKFDFLWRSGLGGSIVSGLSFVIAACFIYKTALLLTGHKLASFIGALLFIVNPNALYVQSTALTEMPLIAFFTASIYFFIRYLKEDSNILLLIAAAFLGMLTTLVRYDGWFLVLFMALILALKYTPWKNIYRNLKKLPTLVKQKEWTFMEGRVIVFCTMAFLGIGLWFVWDFLILGDPLYFTNSEFSAKSQQMALLAANQLPAYKNIFKSFEYYFMTSASNLGLGLFLISILGFAAYIFTKKENNKFYIALILSVIFIFNVYTLYAGQSVIFIPEVNPQNFKENIFNVRYGLMMLPFACLFSAYLFYKSKKWVFRSILAVMLLAQIGIFYSGHYQIITLEDGLKGISSSIADKDKIEASAWFRDNYKGGFVMLDDYARPVSIIESRLPMNEVIYIGSKPYWEESIQNPQKYAEWIVLKQGDTVWKNIYKVPEAKKKLDQYFTLLYSSQDRMIFKRKQLEAVSKPALKGEIE